MIPLKLMFVEEKALHLHCIALMSLSSGTARKLVLACS